MKKLVVTSFFVLSGLFFVFQAFAAQRTGCPQTGLVPCGTPGCPCTLCDFFVMFDRIIDFLLVPTIYNNYFPLVPAIGALMLAIGGFIYMFAYGGMGEGGPEQTNKAKKIFASVVIGFIIVYSAWLLVGLFFQAIGTSEWTGLKEGWWEIECDPESVRVPSNLPKTPPRNRISCVDTPGCFWITWPWGSECVCPHLTDNCMDCRDNKECCAILGWDKCKWEEVQVRGGRIHTCQNK